MSDEFDSYHIKNPATDLFRVVSDLEIDTGSGVIPLDYIINQEAIARCERFLREHLEIRSEQEDIKRALKEYSMRTLPKHTDDTWPL